MGNKYFNIKDSLFDITEKYDEAIDLLVSLGFKNIKEENQRKTFGKSISLENALKVKKINIDKFVEKLINEIETNKNKTQGSLDKTQSIKIAGVLPCPVRFPLTEAFEGWLEENKSDFDCNIEYELKPASVGVNWLKDFLQDNSQDNLPDIFISAGFDLFFSEELFGKYKTQNVFEDITEYEHYNKDFENEYINLKDPDRQYSMIGVVPAIFLVNKEELKGRKMPTSWEDILKDEFNHSVSLPVGDFDLFNSILLNIFKKFGEKGVKKLGEILQRSMHPSEMVKSNIGKSEKPTVTIMPYFFTNMIKEDGAMTPVWPKDGAIISPIFMLCKKEKANKIKSIVDFFSSKKVGEILSHNGKFPSVNPEVENGISENNKYMWIGWDYIQNNDIAALIKTCDSVFNKSVKGEL
ncbi:ABC transporter substrate-binding protein [Clostridium niameyense]|uniref:ABC transporter substrate-binding protein n=1 Tax=Clostridium niameyense TaxID=1622073 RepID=A0A6M0R6J8_9CLOT|nr:ABC transporter substrate-binding protein [Clostridium niameyense]NEZ45783.1 ABC transporter substrate-binding protein [Clostridium niameyense]